MEAFGGLFAVFCMGGWEMKKFELHWNCILIAGYFHKLEE